MTKRYADIIKNCKIFSSLDDKACEELADYCQEMILERNEVLFHEGDIADALYIVVTGSLGVEIDIPDSIPLRVRMVNPGELVGEVGILANQPRRATVYALENTLLLKLLKNDYQSYAKTHAMDNVLMNLVKSCKMFRSLKNEDFDDLLSYMEIVNLLPDEILFQQGEPSDFICVPISGRLIAVLTTAIGKQKVVGTIEIGETVGEMGIISGKERSLTIKALHPCILLKLYKTHVKAFAHKYPSLVFEMIGALVRRSQKALSLLADKVHSQNIAIIALNKDVRFTEFKFFLVEQLKHFKNVIVIMDSYKEDPLNILKSASLVYEKDTVILYLLEAHETALSRACFHYIEHVFVLADSRADNFYSEFVLDFLANQVNIQARRELVVLRDDDIEEPQNTRQLLTKLNFDYFSFYHHVRVNHVHDYWRLLRFISGKSVGLVLGGGGTRGWTQLGVIKALLEEGIKIDAIGGTSVGSLVAGCFAIEQTYQGMYERFKEVVKILKNPYSMGNFTWPVISLLSAKSGTIALQKVFGDLRIEDCRQPYFCLTSNLNQNQEVVHRTGYFWEKIRGSVSLPGLMPPMVMNGQLHLDGGLFNNLPVDVMKTLFCNKGYVIAVNLTSIKEDKTVYNFPPIMTFKNAFLAAFIPHYKSYVMPHYFDTFIKSLLLGGTTKQMDNRLIADLLINPDLGKYGMLEIKPSHVEKLIEIGYNATKEQLLILKKEGKTKI